MRTLSTLLLVATACSSSRPPPSSPPQQQATVVEWEVHGQEEGGPAGAPGAQGGAPGGAAPADPAAAPAAAPDRSKAQPPDVKLKLGHYRNARHNIGLVIDRTNKEARIKFDHVADVMRLDPMRSSGRIDYVKTINQTVLQIWDSGRVVVFVPGTSEAIDVVRDGDADPL